MVDFMCITKVILLKPNFSSISITPYKNTPIFCQTASMNMFFPFRTRNLLHFYFIFHKILNPNRNLYKCLNFFFLFSLLIRMAQLFECIITIAINMAIHSNNTYITTTLFHLFDFDSFEMWGLLWCVPIRRCISIFAISFLE